MSLRRSVRYPSLSGISSHHVSLSRRYTSVPNAQASTPSQPLTSILIANRGEIALSVLPFLQGYFMLRYTRRVGKTASQSGIKTTTIYTDPDAKSQHALSSPFAVNLVHPSAYLDGDKIIKAAKQQGCVGIHPGYGFVCLPDNLVLPRKRLRTF